MNSSQQSAVAMFSAVMAGATPIVGSTVPPEMISRDEPVTSSAYPESGLSTLDMVGSSNTNFVDFTIPQESMNGPYGVCPSLPVPARSAARQLVLERMVGQEAALYAEHSDLVDREFSSGLSPREQRRLEFVRWSLHRIQDAREGHQADALDRRVDDYLAFAAEVRNLTAQILDGLSARGHR